ncbi:EamA family transporter [Hymenobacter sp. BT507]|uniref:EamA family transporter n=1 Tax=Hymenobacter citatus TaxID=2763506 RepID=A0ABR7MGL6_9BACT|nr:EamA family transporter [Hymenobacter citatus]MBC6610219.1 EamA family transporter [Hymenobacter citatus]
MKTSRYYVAALTAFLIWGFFPLPLRQLTVYPSGQILLFRVLLSVLVLLVLHGVGRVGVVRATLRQYRAASHREQWRVAGGTVVGGLLLMSNWLLFIYVINQVSVQAGSFAYLICPILLSLLGFLLLRERLRLPQWLAVGLSALSCTLLVTGDLRSLLMSLVVAITYALYLITQRIVQGYDRLVLLTIQLLLATVILLPAAPLLGADLAAGFADTHLLFFAAILSIGFTVLPLFLNLYALNGLTSGTVGIMMYLNPVVSFVLAFWYFGEQPRPVELWAYAVILVSIVLYNVRGRAVGGPVVARLQAEK